MLGNVGQTDYAFANACLDAFAERRQQQVRAGERSGRTVSIGWPLWADGGMSVDAARLQQLASQGVQPLPSSLGFATLYRLLARESASVALLYGDRARLRSRLFDVRPRPSEPQNVVAAAGAPDVRSRLEAALQAEVSTLLKVPLQEVDVDGEFGEFGFDSLSFTAFGNALNRSYGLELLPTLFFEHSTVSRLATHLLGKYPQLRERLAPTAAPTAMMIASAPATTHSERREPAQRRRFVPTPASLRRQQQRSRSRSSGISGRFPQARDLDELWENLRLGRDCVTEIPAQRWDWRALHGDPAASTTRRPSSGAGS